MAETVTTPNTILLNGYKYKIRGPVVSSFLDPFPDQIIVGEADYATRRELSSWIISGLRGIGVEEMDERTDAGKCWWTNCITDYKGHTLPPRKATAITAPTQPASITPTLTNADMEAAASGWTGGARDNAQAHGGTYSYVVGAGSTTYQDAATWDNAWRGRNFTFTIWYYPIAGSNGTPQINDGVTTFSGTVSAGAGGAWEQLTVRATLGATATRLRVQVVEAAGSGYVDDATIAATNSTIGTAAKFCNFNGVLYLAQGAYLYKLASDRASWTYVAEFPATITSMTASLNSRLYIYLGDSVNYYWMSTAEVFTQSNSALANWGFQYDAKLFKVATTGAATYSTDPDAGGPTWTTAGTITDIASQIQGFVVGRDAAGTESVYCATKSIQKVLDLATPQWNDTEVHLPSHPNGGKGFTYFNGKLYFSYGLAVKEYYPETGSLLDIGLTERDGLPVEYNGEIVKLYGDSGTKGMFASIDASQVTGTAKSGLYAYDGNGWHCWWADTSNDGAMTDIIVSSASSAYAIYWDCGGTIYYIDIPRGVQNPDKITQSYATAGIFVSSWFDATNQTVAKLAKSLVDFASGVTATETVALKYRLDHANTDLDTGWTTLDTLNTTGETGLNEELFASGAGLSFKSIQFRLDFVTAGSTAKADIKSLVLYFKKRTGSEKLRSWAVTAIIDNESGNTGNTSANQKVANLISAVTSGTDVLFSYHPNYGGTETHYVSVECPKLAENTGDDYQGDVNLVLVEA